MRFAAIFFQEILRVFRNLFSMSDVTRIVNRVESGDAAASGELLPLVYNELRRLASQRLAKYPGQSLQTTDLVHEAYLRLVGHDEKWEGRSHFFAAAAEAIRRVLVDRARRKQRRKHGGDRRQVALHESAASAGCTAEEVVIVNELFDRLADQYPVEAEVAKLRYFAGFNHRETAEALEIPVSTAHAHWAFAKAWLYREYRKE
jgi:RNA polymerase sigma factor (TIGR02999 family)